MGPYCRFCGCRCFVHITEDWPAEIRDAYGAATIAATCLAGQRFEQDKVGYCYADAIRLLARAGAPETSA